MADDKTYTAEQLSEQYKCKVIEFTLQPTLESENQEPATGYLKSPNIDMKLRLLDAISNGNAATVASQILDAHLLKSESDARINKTDDEYWLGACSVVIRTVKSASGEIKKN